MAADVWAKPFSSGSSSKAFFIEQEQVYDRRSIVDAYMAFGGIPQL
jgi:hypothetical protein